MTIGSFARARRTDTEALRYAEACLRQGMGYQSAAAAAGVCETDLREFLPGRGPAGRDTSATSQPSVVAACAGVISNASPAELGRIAALALGLLHDRAGPQAVRHAYESVSLALTAGASGCTPREQMLTIVDGVASQYGVTREQIMSQSRVRKYAHPRQHAMWAVQQATSLSIPAIGRLFGRDHSTVLHGIRAHAARTQAGAA